MAEIQIRNDVERERDTVRRERKNFIVRETEIRIKEEVMGIKIQ